LDPVTVPAAPRKVSSILPPGREIAAAAEG
jgi:hypothetical protein